MLHVYKWLPTGHPRSISFKSQSNFEKLKKKKNINQIKLLPGFKVSKRNTELNTEHTCTYLKSSHNPYEKIQISFHLLTVTLPFSFSFFFPHVSYFHTLGQTHWVHCCPEHTLAPHQLDTTSITLRTSHLLFALPGTPWIFYNILLMTDFSANCHHLRKAFQNKFCYAGPGAQPKIFIWAFALVSWGCHNKIP